MSFVPASGSPAIRANGSLTPSVTQSKYPSLKTILKVGVVAVGLLFSASYIQNPVQVDSNTAIYNDLSKVGPFMPSYEEISKVGPSRFEKELVELSYKAQGEHWLDRLAFPVVAEDLIALDQVSLNEKLLLAIKKKDLRVIREFLLLAADRYMDCNEKFRNYASSVGNALVEGNKSALRALVRCVYSPANSEKQTGIIPFSLSRAIKIAEGKGYREALDVFKEKFSPDKPLSEITKEYNELIVLLQKLFPNKSLAEIGSEFDKIDTLRRKFGLVLDPVTEKKEKVQEMPPVLIQLYKDMQLRSEEVVKADIDYWIKERSLRN